MYRLYFQFCKNQNHKELVPLQLVFYLGSIEVSQTSILMYYKLLLKKFLFYAMINKQSCCHIDHYIAFHIFLCHNTSYQNQVYLNIQIYSNILVVYPLKTFIIKDRTSCNMVLFLCLLSIHIFPLLFTCQRL